MAYGYGPKPAYHSKSYHKEALRTVYRRRLDHLGLKLQQLELGGDVENTEREGVAFGSLLGSVQLPGSTLADLYLPMLLGQIDAPASRGLPAFFDSRAASAVQQIMDILN
eukprot:s2923_g2.t1